MMNPNDFYPQKYEQLLTPLGRGVLKELIKLREKECEQNRRIVSECWRYKSAAAATAPPSSTRLVTCSRDENSFDVYENRACQIVGLESGPNGERASVVAPSTAPLHIAQLVSTLTDLNPPQIDVVRTDQLVNSVLDTNKNNVSIVNSKVYENRRLCDIVTFKNSEDLTDSMSNKVGWDEMFDTELLGDVNVSPCEPSNKYDTTSILNDKTFRIVFPNSETDDITENKVLNNKSKKRKNQSKITETISKKVKRVEIECSETLLKSRIRKQKYTKTVKSWLDNVDIDNTIQAELPTENFKNCFSTEKTVKDEIKKATNQVNLSPKINNLEIDNREQKPTSSKPKKASKQRAKKTIQTQLANKDGKMKFSKDTTAAGLNKALARDSNSKIIADEPKENAKDILGSELSDVGVPQIVTVSDKNDQPETAVTSGDNNAAKPARKIKETKTKAKFVAPIKSELPVKDVTYDVRAITSPTDAAQLMRLTNTELGMVLMYSNGLSQLSRQQGAGEAECEPAAVMIHCLHIFYHLHGSAQWLSEIFESVLKNNKIICFDGKELLVYLMNTFGLDLYDFKLNIIDVKVCGAVVWEGSPPATLGAAQRALSHTAAFTLASHCPLQRAAWKCTTLGQCAALVETELRAARLWQLYTDVEMPLIPIIAGMEQYGVAVDTALLEETERRVSARVRQLREELRGVSGEQHWPDSVPRTRTLLFHTLRLHTHLPHTHNNSTAHPVLRQLSRFHRVPGVLLEYRRLSKVLSATLGGLRSHLANGLVHPTWEQCSTVSGRVTCSRPNLQAVPKAPFKLCQSSPQDHPAETEEVLLRALAVRRAGGALVWADFRQAECRVAARLAADAALHRLLHQPQDIFAALAAHWEKKDESSVCEAERERTKRVVYAALYGAGPRRLADMLGLTYSQATDLIASFHRAFPSVKRWAEGVVAECERSGEVRTPLGRRRQLRSPATAATAGDTARTHRQAVNFVIQGTAADVCKVGMAAASEALRSAGLRCRLVLQLHDELVWEVPLPHCRRAAQIIRSAMEGCGPRAGVDAHLPVAVGIGTRWGIPDLDYTVPDPRWGLLDMDPRLSEEDPLKSTQDHLESDDLAETVLDSPQ